MPTTFAHRINVFLSNHVRNETGCFTLEVKTDELLNTPMKALEAADLISRVEEPAQGHDGKSIMRRGRSTKEASPQGFPRAGEDEDEDEEVSDGNPMPGPYASADQTRIGSAPKKTPRALPSNAPQVTLPPPRKPSASASRSSSQSAVQTQQTVASLLSSLASSAGLDLVVNHAGRGPARPFPPTRAASNAQEDADEQVLEAHEVVDAHEDPDAPEDGSGGAAQEGAVPKGAEGAVPVGANKGKRKAKAQEKPTKAAASKQSKRKGKEPLPVVPPSLSYLDSSVANQYAICDDELKTGSLVAFNMNIRGTQDWYVGEVLRVSKPYWSDVHFSDGKLWMKTKLSERDAMWHVVRSLGEHLQECAA